MEVKNKKNSGFFETALAFHEFREFPGQDFRCRFPVHFQLCRYQYTNLKLVL